ncbi:MAG TPA: hypothetical protein VIY27_13780 [Myxococcota bacterium]
MSDDDIIDESSGPIPAGALYFGSPPIDLSIRHHRPKYDTVEIGRGRRIDPDPSLEHLVDALTP